jgi:hypothetical protein
MRSTQLAPRIDSSITARMKCVQLAARLRMPGTISSSTVPVIPASTPIRKAPKAAQPAACDQNVSPVHQ